MKGLFKMTLDTQVAETPNRPGFDIRPLLDHFGKDVTWRHILAAEPSEITGIPGYGPRTEEQIRRFISENIQYTFENYLNSKPAE